MSNRVVLGNVNDDSTGKLFGGLFKELKGELKGAIKEVKGEAKKRIVVTTKEHITAVKEKAKAKLAEAIPLEAELEAAKARVAEVEKKLAAVQAGESTAATPELEAGTPERAEALAALEGLIDALDATGDTNPAAVAYVSGLADALGVGQLEERGSVRASLAASSNMALGGLATGTAFDAYDTAGIAGDYSGDPELGALTHQQAAAAHLHAAFPSSYHDGGTIVYFDDFSPAIRKDAHTIAENWYSKARIGKARLKEGGPLLHQVIFGTAPGKRVGQLDRQQERGLYTGPTGSPTRRIVLGRRE